MKPVDDRVKVKNITRTDKLPLFHKFSEVLVTERRIANLACFLCNELARNVGLVLFLKLQREKERNHKNHKKSKIQRCGRTFFNVYSTKV